MERIRYEINGVVQGVGFRPFIYRLATDHQLAGWVVNSTQGVVIEVEGLKTNLASFEHELHVTAPPHAVLTEINTQHHEIFGYTGFEIRPSVAEGQKSTLILPDLATCPDCQREIFDPTNRRYHYPFTNCTHCGPRFTIIEALPYDRPHTAMKHFVMCPDCQAEYENPLDRRFHAQPNACATCGPHLELLDNAGNSLSTHADALTQAVDALRAGLIVAVKGLGGFHLLVDAQNETAIQTLRQRKQRPHKPLAVMFPNLAQLESYGEVSTLERELLTNSSAPIVLVPKRQPLAPSIAPDNPYLGAFLPYTPLHWLLLAEFGAPLVATSGNVANEPICIDEHHALHYLAGVADLFLVHNRPILRPVDDSVVRVIHNTPVILRRARGYAPLPIETDYALPPLLAVGGQQKNTIAFSQDKHIFLSQHLGDLGTSAAMQTFEQAVRDLPALYEVTPKLALADAHPDYGSRHYADTHRPQAEYVQHHYAHVLAGMAEHHLEGPVLGIAWDGTGYGEDGTIWGGEFLRVDEAGFHRVGHLRNFRLLGGEAAIRDPRRIAFALLYQAARVDVHWGDFPVTTRQIYLSMLERGINSPLTSSAGRLFDGVSALLGFCEESTYEAQAAMQLEFAAATVPHDTVEAYPFYWENGVLDWRLMLHALLIDLHHGKNPALLAARFQHTLVEMMVAVAETVMEPCIVLTGGCFQNRPLTEWAIDRLTEAGFTVYWHQSIPPNDGGLAVGQLMAGVRSIRGNPNVFSRSRTSNRH